MRIERWILALGAVVVATRTVAAPADAFLGKWDITSSVASGRQVYWLEVKQENGKLVGDFLNRGGSVTRLPEIALADGELVFSPGPEKPGAPKPVHRARVQEGKLHGSLTRGDVVVEWLGVRPPRWGRYDASRKQKLGEPVALFDGKSLEGWTTEFPDKPAGWRVQDGILQNDAGANNLVSRSRFRDFQVEVEYKLEPKSNSGIYLRGRYELQVLDDLGQPPEAHGHMALYSRVAPLVNASRPAGEWQAMEAVIFGNRVSASLNGQKVHDNTIVEGITGGALDSDEGADGPLMIQGDHGRIWIRKVVVTPIIR
jgi:hypothetical protein